MKKTIALIQVLLLTFLLFTACGTSTAESTPPAVTESQTGSSSNAASTANPSQSNTSSSFDSSKSIIVVSREDGSGTRGAFIELFEIQKKNDAGENVDHTTDEATITNSTSVMMTTVSTNDYAIGYISLGSLNDTVKALAIDSADATVANIIAGSYKISRPFNIAVKEDINDLAKDFIDFILSKDGQEVISGGGYIAVSENAAFNGTKPSGKIVVAGSSSVTPIMEKLKEAYLSINPNAEIEIQQSDSSTGMTAAIDGICDIGMASRELKDSEKDAGLVDTRIAIDGIAVIVNNNNPLSGVSKDTIMEIFTGEIEKWSDVA